jgi:fatty-acyl-CoA synthase
MSLWARAAIELKFLSGTYRTLRRIGRITRESPQLACDDLEAAVDKYADRTAIEFEGRSLTYAQFDAIANRYAHWALGLGLKRGDTVALFAQNSLDYSATWYGLSKVGVITALINHQLTGAALVHSLHICNALHVIADAETAPAFAAVTGQLQTPIRPWLLGERPPGDGGPDSEGELDQALRSASSLRPDRATARSGMVAKDVALYLFTSGTTGLPKAAKVTHVRVLLYMHAFAAATNSKPSDRFYNCLPLYHATGGLCAMGAALLTGGCVVLRRRFSATQFWPDVVAQKCTIFVYIGELCRYLVNLPVQPAETQHRLRLAFGNGLRPDVWEQMAQRFKIPHILEFYGSTEGNVSLLNLDGKVGAIGRIPNYLRSRFNARLVQFDMDTQTPKRNAQGGLTPCKPGEVGEMIGKIGGDARSDYVGYADKTATNRKVVNDAFVKGDSWFLTGDLMRQDREGYLYFIDRVGDTFRWKGENVSTNEVEERLSEISSVLEANVYGVRAPGTDGRAGMAALVVDDRFDLAAFQAAVQATLPAYAQPVFLRLQQHMDTTGTFKRRKTDVAAEGFDPAAVHDPLFVKLPQSGYQPIDAALHRRIQSGEVRL